MAGPDVGTRPRKKKTIKKGTPSRRGGSVGGGSLKTLKKTAWVQTGGAHRAAWKHATGTIKAVATDPMKAQKAGQKRVKKVASKGASVAKRLWRKAKGK